MISYKLPVRLTHDFLIIDAEGKTVLPDITWKPDLDHRARQKEIGEWIVNNINNENIVDENKIVATESVKNGHPMVRNPWGRSGRPK